MTAELNNTISIAVDTSGHTGSVAVARGDKVLQSDSFSTRFHHGVELLPTADRLCRSSNIDPATIEHIYVSGGPGSFTGLRIGITFAKAMAYGVNAQTVRVPTLEVIAQNALELSHPPKRVAVILDAKRQNVYCAAFELEQQRYIPMDEPDERDPQTYLSSLGDVSVLGEGLVQHADVVRRIATATILKSICKAARAETVFKLGHELALAGKITPIEQLTPIYIRRPEAEERWEQRHGQ